MNILHDLTFILNGTLGLICAIMVLFSIKSNRAVNTYLAIMLFFVSIRFILRGYFELTNQSDFISKISKGIAFVFGFPLPYLYCKQLVFHERKPKVKNLLHFILPAFLFVENKFHVFGDIFEVELKGFISFLLIILFLIYFILVTHLLVKYIWKKPRNIEIESHQAVLLKKWTFIFYIAFALIGIRLFSAITLMQNNEFISDIRFLWMNSLVWFIVFMMIITSPSIINGYIGQLSRDRQEGAKSLNYWRLKPVSPITNVQDIQLSLKINTELDAHFQQIEQFIKQEHFFRQSGLSINDLALKLKMPKSHLSFIFKYHSTISFSDFKKLNRIQDAIALINEGYLKTNTFDSLSKMVGFSTYNTFYIAFKEVTNKAPQEYINGINEYGLKPVNISMA
jgi:AraC-like DNA-binding protein